MLEILFLNNFKMKYDFHFRIKNKHQQISNKKMPESVKTNEIKNKLLQQL